MSVHVNAGGVWKTVNQPHANVAGVWKPARAMYTNVGGVWKEVWPVTGSPKIIGPSYGTGATLPIPVPGPLGLVSDLSLWGPRVPFYTIAGDRSQIASARIDMRWTPKDPKSPVEHTVAFDVPVGWGLYHVVWPKDTSNNNFYIAAMTDAEVAALRATNTRVVTTLWTPRDGGHFAYMPACWDAVGITVPAREGDPYTGYDPSPARSATSALADYTVANGYNDMGYSYLAALNTYTSVTITIRNSGGATLDTWTGTIAPPAAFLKRSVEETDFFWPTQWRSLFDSPQWLNRDLDIKWGRDTVHGIAEFDVYKQGEIIGDFRLALRRGIWDTIEILGVNLREDLIGMSIMRIIVEHGVRYCPTRYVMVTPPNKPTYDVMRSWGWEPLEDNWAKLNQKSLYWVSTDEGKTLFYDTHVPMYNRFSELRLPPIEEIVSW